jgi:DNA-binding NarL/FixJ family response regulator
VPDNKVDSPESTGESHAKIDATGIAEAVTELVAQRSESGEANGAQKMDQLTPRQYQVATLVARGLSNKEVARELGLVAGTVKVHMHQIIKKLGAKTRYEVIVMTMMRPSSRKQRGPRGAKRGRPAVS